MKGAALAETLQRLTPWIVGAWLALLFMAERVRPLRGPTSGWRRVGLNVGVTALALGVAAVTVVPTVAGMLVWTRDAQFGLLHWAGLPPLLSAAVGFLLLDLAFYWWHRLNHVWPLLWRFHNVHHIDPNLDSTTSFRFHPGEIAYSAGFRVVQIGLIGPTAATFFVYELVFLAETVFHHSNVRLPVTLERWLNRVIVTPRMHGIHHSVVRDETNSNYSVVFRWWDVLHRSLRLNIPQDDIRIGVAAYSHPDDNAPVSVLALPFRTQREYWRLPQGDDSRTRPDWDPDQRGRMAG
jgi:sterol desaturase/sphingolipid hydroxylase (fatty acid hydroxylase superfamily)